MTIYESQLSLIWPTKITNTCLYNALSIILLKKQHIFYDSIEVGILIMMHERCMEELSAVIINLCALLLTELILLWVCDHIAWHYSSIANTVLNISIYFNFIPEIFETLANCITGDPLDQPILKIANVAHISYISLQYANQTILQTKHEQRQMVGVFRRTNSHAVHKYK